jgi:hypothetical protein
MSGTRIALLAAASMALFCAQAVSGPPLKTRWRAADVGTDIPAMAYIAPTFLPSAVVNGQVAYVDPATGRHLPSPPLDAAGRPDFVRLPDTAARMRAGRTPSGILFIETNGYHETLTVTLDADGTPHYRCMDPSHGHALPADAAAGPGAER